MLQKVDERPAGASTGAVNKSPERRCPEKVRGGLEFLGEAMVEKARRNLGLADTKGDPRKARVMA